MAALAIERGNLVAYHSPDTLRANGKPKNPKFAVV